LGGGGGGWRGGLTGRGNVCGGGKGGWDRVMRVGGVCCGKMRSSWWTIQDDDDVDEPAIQEFRGDDKSQKDRFREFFFRFMELGV